MTMLPLLLALSPSWALSSCPSLGRSARDSPAGRDPRFSSRVQLQLTGAHAPGSRPLLPVSPATSASLCSRFRRNHDCTK